MLEAKEHQENQERKVQWRLQVEKKSAKRETRNKSSKNSRKRKFLQRETI